MIKLTFRTKSLGYFYWFIYLFLHKKPQELKLCKLIPEIGVDRYLETTFYTFDTIMYYIKPVKKEWYLVLTKELQEISSNLKLNIDFNASIWRITLS